LILFRKFMFSANANLSYVINVLWIKSSSLICENEY